MQAIIPKMNLQKNKNPVQLDVTTENLYLSGGAGKKSILLCLDSKIAAAVWAQARCSQHDIAFLLASAKAFNLKVTNGEGKDIPLIYEDAHSGVVRPEGVIATKIMDEYTGWHDTFVEMRKQAKDEIVDRYDEWVLAEGIRQQKQLFNDVFLAKKGFLQNILNGSIHSNRTALVNAMLTVEAKAREKLPPKLKGELVDIRKAQLEWYKWIKNSLRELESLKSASNACSKSSVEFEEYLRKYHQSSQPKEKSSKIYSWCLGLVAWVKGQFRTLTEHELTAQKSMKPTENEITAEESIEECGYKYQQAQISAQNALKALLEFKVNEEYAEDHQSRDTCEAELEVATTKATNSRTEYQSAEAAFCGTYGITPPAA